MRLLATASTASAFVVLGLFLACGGTDTGDMNEAGVPDSPADMTGDPFVEAGGGGDADGGGVRCSLIQGAGSADPVDLCVLRAVLEDQHEHGFTTSGGTYSSWNYETLNPDLGAGGKPIHDFHDDAAYGASCYAYHTWAGIYGDPPEFDSDLLALAPILEAELATLPEEYDGELYFNLRKVAAGLTAASDMVDAAKIDAIADRYARQIFTSFYTAFPGSSSDAGPPDTGSPDTGSKEGGAEAGGGPDAGDAAVTDGAPSDTGKPDALDGSSGNDAAADPHPDGDGIIGVNQSSTGGVGILYQPASVASAAYALVDLAQANPADTNVGGWLEAARRSLDHIHNRARDTGTGLYFYSLVTTGGSSDALGPLMTPTNLLSADVQATVMLYLIRAQQEVVENTMPADGGTETTLKSLVDFPFLARSSALLGGVQMLWDGLVPLEGGVDGGTLPPGDTVLGGLMDGYIPSTMEFVRTKSTRANAYMFAVNRLQFIAATGPLGGVAPPTPREGVEGPLIQVLLSNEPVGSQTMNDVPNHNLLTVVPYQFPGGAYFATTSQTFELLPKGPGTTTQSYAASAIAATVQGFDAQLVGFHP